MKRKKSVSHKKKSTETPIVIKVSLIILVFFVLFATVFKITEFVLTNQKPNAFPKLEISLKDVPLEQINAGSKDLKYPNNVVTLTANDKSTIYEDVEIKGRGNSTWMQLKRPYQIKFSEKVSLLNQEKAKKWILLADYFDNTHLRNNLAFYLERLLESPYPLSGEYAELYVDHNYYGLYYITEKIEIDKNRVDLTDPLGIIVELDNLHNNKGCAAHSLGGNCFTIQDVVNSDNSDAAMVSFATKFNRLENAIAKKDYHTIAELIDVDSFVKYFLLSEFINNPDAYSTSFFMYQNGAEDKIHAGPGWDFDLALGSRGWIEKGIDQEVFLSPFNTLILKSFLSMPDQIPHAKNVSTIIFDLLDVPDFNARIKEVYQTTLSGKSEKLLDYIKTQAEYIKPAVEKDQERWKLKFNFDDEIDYLIDWVAKRYDHFEQTYGAQLPSLETN